MNSNSTGDLTFSRPEAAAVALGEFAPDSKSYSYKPVLLTGESSVLRTENGRTCLLDSFRLLTRFCRNISIHLPEDSSSLKVQLQLLARAIRPDLNSLFEDDPRWGDFAAILSVGTHIRTDLPWTVINSNGWVARVSSGHSAIPGWCEQTNPIGALGAACFGAAEVFKRLIHLKPDRGTHLDAISFSFYSYDSNSDGAGPELPAHINLDFMLVGLGAIGNGVVHLLQSLPVEGSVSIVDHQEFGPENLGTCILIGPDHLGRSKASVGEALLKKKLEAIGYPSTLQELEPRFGADIPFPSIIVNAVDNIDARRCAQDLWPDVIFDGAIGDFACEATARPWNSDFACLLCDFRPATQNAEELQIKLSGLTKERLADPDSPVNKKDIALAPEDKKEWLSERLGKRICSVVSEATIKEISTLTRDTDFRPSVPFVACLSACMLVSELVKYATHSTEFAATGYRFDILIGPECGQLLNHARRPECKCVERRASIEMFRAERSFVQGK